MQPKYLTAYANEICKKKKKKKPCDVKAVAKLVIHNDHLKMPIFCLSTLQMIKSCILFSSCTTCVSYQASFYFFAELIIGMVNEDSVHYPGSRVNLHLFEVRFRILLQVPSA